MKLIPTPYRIQCDGASAPIAGIDAIICQIPMDETIAWGLEQVKATVDETGGEALLLCHGDDPFFSEKNAAEQGYILRRNEDGLTLTAQSSIGFLYGLMTLLQVAEQAPARFTIYDKPQIRFRGNMNTLWAESGVWTYDFGDGLDAAVKRLKNAIDQMAKAKLNFIYVDAFGFRTERFPGYDATMREISEYGRIRGVRMMAGGYGMGYGLSALGNFYMGKVFYNRYPYPDGELYPCIGRCGNSEDDPIESLGGREYGTCLSNDDLTADKISEIRDYIRATGIRTFYLHNMDADEIHGPLWRGRCEHCRKRYPNDDLFAKDGCAGAFADFYDKIMDALLPEFPDLLICPVSPGYAYAYGTNDEAFEKCRKFWAATLTYCRNADKLIPLFRELFYQWDEPKLRFELLAETVPSFGSIFFSSSDGHYSDKIYTPSAAYAAAMKDADMILCANGGALQKPIQLTNAEFLWNPTGSAFYQLEIAENNQACMEHYDAFREGYIRPDGIYGEDGLLETSCKLLFGKENAKKIADIFRIQGKNGESPIFTACNTELWTKGSRVNFPMLWDTPMEKKDQKLCRERFYESTLATAKANTLLGQLDIETLDEDSRAHFDFLKESTGLYTELCRQLTEYMDLYMAADLFLKDGTALDEDFDSRCKTLIADANKMLAFVNSDGRKAFDPLGGVIWRRDEIFDFIAYCAGQILQSIATGERIPPERRPLKKKGWW